MSEAMDAKLREDKEFWYCINGHRQHFVAKSDLEKTQELLETQRRWTAEAQRQRDEAQRSLQAQKAVTTRIKNRVGNGVCPCCKRSFCNLQRHMSTKHPEFKDEKG